MKRSVLSLIGAAAAVALVAPAAHADLPGLTPGDCNGATLFSANQACFQYLANSAVSTQHYYFDATGQFTDGGANIAPLNTPFAIFCVDQQGETPTVGQQYVADVTALSPLDVGAFDGAYPPYHSGTNEWKLYDQSAWVVEQWFLAGGPGDGGSPLNTQDYQFAIWSIMNGSCSFGGTACGRISGLLTGAASLTDAQLQAAADDGEWSIISDTGTSCTKDNAAVRCQEFLYFNPGAPPTEVPEPGTMSLLALGLSAMAGAGFRRRKH